MVDNGEFVMYNGGVKAIIKVALPVLVAFVGVTMASTPTRSDFDIQGLNKQVQSLDARTTNNEKDIKVLQDTTNTPPAEHVAVPTPSTPEPVPTPAPGTPTPAVAPTNTEGGSSIPDCLPGRQMPPGYATPGICRPLPEDAL